MRIARAEAPAYSSLEYTGVRAEAIAELRAAFEREHHVVLPRVLDGRLLEDVTRGIEDAGWEETVHPGIKVELGLPPCPAWALLFFLANDVRLFEFVRAVTGCPRIGSFAGRVYRMDPGPEHRDGWHDDMVRGRLVAMSVNLSPEPYEGGVLELRDKESKRVHARVANTGLGDALLFRLAPHLEHRVTGVEGASRKVAFAGWFRDGEDSFLASA
jgi:2OG-Fe(II) oxygenase superfamily